MAQDIDDEANFCARASAIDALEVHVLDRPDATASQWDEAQRIKSRLEDVDAALFRRLRDEIRSGASVRELLNRYVPSARRDDPVRYDLLDQFINGLLLWRTLPPETSPGHPEMIRYQQTPTRFVLDMIDRGWLAEDDRFIDIGSGLGQVVILVNLLMGIPSTGLEIDPALCDYATRSAEELNLTGVRFLNVDAREASYADGTAFFLYTPFVGSVLGVVMEKLREEGAKKLITYGPITAQIGRLPWVRPLAVHHDFALFAGE